MEGVRVLRGEVLSSGYSFSGGYSCGASGGYGDGNSYGCGYGDGGGDGYGDGSGFGSGAGYGSGSSDGDGHSDGDSQEYWQAAIQHFAAKWPTWQQDRLRECQRLGSTIAFWLSDERGMPANGGELGIEAAAPGVIHGSCGPLELCRAGTLHATLVPPRWEGSRWWIVVMHGEIARDGSDKIGALAREILGECL